MKYGTYFKPIRFLLFITIISVIIWIVYSSYSFRGLYLRTKETKKEIIFQPDLKNLTSRNERKKLYKDLKKIRSETSSPDYIYKNKIYTREQLESKYGDHIDEAIEKFGFRKFRKNYEVGGETKIKRGKLYEYLKAENLTDLSFEEFSIEYGSNSKKQARLYRHLKDNKLTSLDADTFANEYFGGITKRKDSIKELTKDPNNTCFHDFSEDYGLNKEKQKELYNYLLQKEEIFLDFNSFLSKYFRDFINRDRIKVVDSTLINNRNDLYNYLKSAVPDLRGELYTSSCVHDFAEIFGLNKEKQKVLYGKLHYYKVISVSLKSFHEMYFKDVKLYQ